MPKNVPGKAPKEQKKIGKRSKYITVEDHIPLGVRSFALADLGLLSRAILHLQLIAQCIQTALALFERIT